MSRYTNHVYDRYEKTNDINYLYNYSKFVLRPQIFSDYEVMKKNLNGDIDYLLTRTQFFVLSNYSPVFDNEREYSPIFSAFFLSSVIFSPNNFGRNDAKLGYFDHEFQDFLIKVLNKDFKGADKIIDRQYTKSFEQFLKGKCFMSTFDNSL